MVPGVTAPHFIPAHLKVRWVVMSPRPPLGRSARRDDLLERPWGRYSPFIVQDVIYVGGWLEGIFVADWVLEGGRMSSSRASLLRLCIGGGFCVDGFGRWFVANLKGRWWS